MLGGHPPAGLALGAGKGKGREEGGRGCTNLHNQAVRQGRQSTFTLLDVVVVDEGFAKVCQTGELGFGGDCSQQLFG